jgi:hypothetical protein
MRCKQAYWDIPKSARIEHGLRPDVTQVGYSGDWAMKIAEDLIAKGLRGAYPTQPDEIHLKIAPVLAGKTLPASIASPAALIELVDKVVTGLEAKIAAYQAQLGAAKV